MDYFSDMYNYTIVVAQILFPLITKNLSFLSVEIGSITEVHRVWYGEDEDVAGEAWFR